MGLLTLLDHPRKGMQLQRQQRQQQQVKKRHHLTGLCKHQY
jgi:hypothetical protein